MVTSKQNGIAKEIIHLIELKRLLETIRQAREEKQFQTVETSAR